MSCAHDAALWTFSEGGLSPEERAVLTAHLETCEACRASLSRVQSTRSALRAAASAMPPVNWRAADDKVMGAATEHVARSVRWRIPIWALGTSLAAACLALVVWAPWRDSALSPATSTALAEVTVESADHATMTNELGGSGLLAAGGTIRQDASIATGEGGNALVRLPDQSRARLSAKSRASVTRATKSEIAIKLDEGAIAVQAAHVARKEFLIDADAVQVRVVGTAFRVERGEARVVISVAEGRVLVEPKRGESRLIGAGHRVVVAEDGAWMEDVALDSQDELEFAQLGVRVARAEAPSPAIAAAPPAVPNRRAPMKDRGGKPVPGPAPVELPPAAPVPSLTPPPSSPSMPPPSNAEGLFLQRAQDALKRGKCQNFQLGLQDVVEGSEDRSARETAQILRARCFDEQLKPDAASGEYRRYLKAFPDGRFAAEAKRALDGMN